MKIRTKEIMDQQMSIMLECIRERGSEGDIPASIVLANDDDLNVIEFFFDSKNTKDRILQMGLASVLLQSASSSRYGQLKKHLFHHRLTNMAISPVLFKIISNPNLVVATFHGLSTICSAEDEKKDVVISIAKEKEGQSFSRIKFYAFKDHILEVIHDESEIEVEGWIAKFISFFPFDLLEKRDVIQEYFNLGRRLYAQEKMQAQGMSILAAGVVD